MDSFNYSDCPGHPKWLEPKEWLGSNATKTYPLHLISGQPENRLHSQLDNGKHSKKSKIHGREPLLINPNDAKIRNLKKPLEKSGIKYEQIFRSIQNLSISKATLDNYLNKIFRNLIKKKRKPKHKKRQKRQSLQKSFLAHFSKVRNKGASCSSEKSTKRNQLI